MKPISEEEAAEFEDRVRRGYKLIAKYNELLAKDPKSEKDTAEMSRIESDLYEIEKWFIEPKRL